MKAILLTDLKIALSLAAFFAVYKLAFGYDTFFVRNRLFLLTAIVVSFTAPWLKFVNTVYVKVSPLSYVPDVTNINIAALPVQQHNPWQVVLNIALAVYLLGVLFYLVRFVWAYHKVIRLILKSEKKKFQDLILVITRLSVTPFSLLKWLVVPSHQVDHPGFENIVQHESIHCRQYHSVDLFLAELMVAFQWFNPFAWWLKRSMVENHEFIVDREILQCGMDTRKYQYLLLNLSTGSYQPAGVNYFNTNLLKKRIRMMNKTRTPRWYGLKNGMVLISIAMVVALTATFETKVIAQDPDNDPLVIINGKKSDNKTLQAINPENIKAIEVMKDSKAVSKYGKDGKSGVIEVTLKDTLISQNSGNTNGIKIVGYGSQKTFSDTANNKGELKVVGHGPFVLSNPFVFPADYNKYSKPLVFLDDKKMGCVSADEINSYRAHKMISIEGSEAIKKYGDEAKDGVMLLYTKPDGELPSGIIIRNHPSVVYTRIGSNNKPPLLVVNGKVDPDQDMSKINPNDIDKVEVLKNDDAIKKYGEQAKDGVIMFTLKGVKEVATSSNSLSLTPNPTSNSVEITLKGTNTSGMFDVKIFDKYGKLLVQDKKSGPTFTVSVAGLSTGVYVVAVTGKDTKYTGNLSVVH